MKYLLLSLCLSIFTIFIACQPNSSKTTATPDAGSQVTEVDSIVKPSSLITLTEISLGECMSLAALLARLQDPAFNYPSALMTTQFEILDKDIALNKAKFLAYSLFYYKTAPAKDLVPFTKAQQMDCKSVQLLSASGLWLKYKILESSEKHLKFQPTSEFDESVLAYQKETLFKRYQPIELSIEVVSDTEIKIIKKMRMFDPLCKKKKTGYNLLITETFSWANSDIELPLYYHIEKNFLSLVLSALKTPPWAEPDKALPLATLKEIMTSPVLDEIKICEQ